MKITELSVWKDRKIQIEQYEPYSFAYGMKAELNDGEDTKEQIDEAKKILESFVDRWLDWETKKWKNPKGAVRDIAKGEVPYLG